MKKIALQEQKEIQLKILNLCRDICKKNDLTYYLAYGTLLGSIRHNGYIPWDDDIDLLMPRKDYELFKNIFLNESISTYSISFPGSKGNSNYTFMKVYDNRTLKIEEGLNFEGNNIGVDIDIFPLDGYPAERCRQKMFEKSQLLIFMLFSYSRLPYDQSGNIIKDVLRLSIVWFSKLIGKNKLGEIINDRAKKYEFSQYDTVAMSIAPYEGKIFPMNKSIFSVGQSIFENDIYDIPSDYDSFLSIQYGNYLKLPPLDQQVTHHLYEVFWKEKNNNTLDD